VYIKLKRYDDARKILSEFGASLKDYKAAADSPAWQKRTLGDYEVQYWDRMAKLAHAEGRRLDEMAYLRSAGLASSFQSMFMGEPRWMPKVRQIWIDLGGTEDGFQAWLHPPATGAVEPKPAPPSHPAVVATAGKWTTLDKPLPDFHFADFHARNWTPADFKGKVTLITLWATWCGPCRNELPYLQKLYDKVRDRDGLQIVTFNVDDDLGLIQPFLAENKYSFPVLSAKDYVDKMLGQWSIPRTWIVDSGGTLRAERVGFGNADDTWVDDVIQAMEKAR
jgi:thiol-disulfide isomerase/thioredoxin